MAVSDTAFRKTDNTLAAGNLLQNDGIITIVERDNNNFISTTTYAESIATDLIQELPEAGAAGNLYAGVALVNNPFSVDVVVPTILSAVRTNDTTFVVTLSENVDVASSTKSNDGGFVVHQTGSVGTTYAVSATVGLADEITLTVASTAVSANDGITIKYTAGGNGTVKDVAGNVLATNATGVTVAAWDVTGPVLTGVSVVSDNTVTTTSTTGDIVTAVFTSSEALTANPTVTFGGQAMTFGSVNALEYTYTRTLNGTETEGTANVLATGTDVAGNTTTDTNVGTLTTDFTAPTLGSVTVTDVTTLDVVLSELADGTSITNANDGGYVVKDTATGLNTYAVSAVNPGVDNTHVVLTVANITADAAGGVTVTYATGGNGTVTDVAGIALATDATGVVTGAFTP